MTGAFAACSALLLILCAHLSAQTAPPAARTEVKRAGADWWSLQPVRRPASPRVNDRAWVRNPIDAFVLANLERHGLRPAAPADRAVLLRRVMFDMLGVPPGPAERDAFLLDSMPGAYDRLVDRVLADPRYGERWGRHWLDVARFSESQGFERDIIRDNAWPYRDYVVRSLNADKPYNTFVREQIAGDVLPDATGETIAATGFLVAGPFDEAGSSAASAVLRAQVREDELEDTVGLVGQTFLGLTVNCARCHDHKFDPIPQRDYYRLKSVFEGVHGGDRPLPPAAEDATSASHRRAARRQLDALDTEIRSIEDGLARRAGWDTPGVPAPLARWSFEQDARDEFGTLHGVLHGGAVVADGRLKLNGRDAYMETAPLGRDLGEKTLEAWVLLPNREQRGGGVLSAQTLSDADFDALVYGERQPYKWIAGSGGFQRTRDLDVPAGAVPSPPGQPIHVAAVYGVDNRITFYRNGVPYGESYVPTGAAASLRTFGAREARVLLGLRHIGAGNGYLEGEILEARLYDRALNAAQVAASFLRGVRTGPPPHAEPLTPRDRDRLTGLAAKRETLAAAVAAAPSRAVYAVRPQQPPPSHVLVRGDVQSKGEPVSAGGVSALGHADLGLAPDAPEGDRRLRLAEWIVRSDSPLAARVLVNRVWHYHFGRGIVGTPNDFGYNGEKPTHPELLDWLAKEFMADTGGAAARDPYACGWRLKALHRLILLSNTYRQASIYNKEAAKQDADNRWLWRFAPRRLEGEAIRDAMLVTSGRINWTRGGPGFRPFVETVNNSHFYAVFDKDGPEYNRRTIYRINVDSAKSPLLDSLDCPDPSTKTPRRGTTTTPLQALELMNSRFVLEQARDCADRVRAEAGPDAIQQANRAYLLALGRPPAPDERRDAAALIRTGSAATLFWALLNSSEFLVLR